MVEVIRIFNAPIRSVCYLIHAEKRPEAVIIDPGNEDLSELLSQIERFGLRPEYIMLTHEHFDHCQGVNGLRKRFPEIKLVCSEQCSRCIADPRKNCSVYYDADRAFGVGPADIFAETPMMWHDMVIEFFPVPGHTAASTAIRISKYLFTGDAFIPGIKTVTNLPGGDKLRARESEAEIKELLEKEQLILCPGH